MVIFQLILCFLNLNSSYLANIHDLIMGQVSRCSYAELIHYPLGIKYLQLA